MPCSSISSPEHAPAGGHPDSTTSHSAVTKYCMMLQQPHVMNVVTAQIHLIAVGSLEQICKLQDPANFNNQLTVGFCPS